MSNWVALERVPNRTLAQPIVDLLADNDIPARVQSDDCGGLDPALAFVLGTWVEVPAEHADAARAVVAELFDSSE